MNCDAKDNSIPKKTYLRDDTIRKLEKMTSENDIQSRLKLYTHHIPSNLKWTNPSSNQYITKRDQQ